MNSLPVWKEPRSALQTCSAPLSHPQAVDVVVIGAGIFGITAAYLLRKLGKTVCLLERDTIGGGDTGHTTAHLTYVTDASLSTLVTTFGREKAALAWRAGADAIRLIEAIVRTEAIDCDFQRVDGYVYRAAEDDKTTQQKLEEEAVLINELGFSATWTNSVPVFCTEGIVIPNQAAFHPLKYLEGLAHKLAADEGCTLCEKSEVTEFQADPLQVKANGHWVAASKIVMATHKPLVGINGLIGATLFQSKLSSYSTYAIAADLPDSADERNGLYWDTLDPYHYTRITVIDGRRQVILGGEDHKTGQSSSTESHFSRLEQRLISTFPHAVTHHRWSGQVVETHDGLPYIGPSSAQQFLATGFAGNGMTFGTVAAMMACDFVEDRESPWNELFAPSRKALGTSALEYLRENFDYPYYLLRDHVGASAKSSEAQDVPPGTGCVYSRAGERIACYRDPSGEVTEVSAVCPHMGCIVHWNNAEKTWDCPCHGSRFGRHGELLSGPAETGLAAINNHHSTNQEASRGF